MPGASLLSSDPDWGLHQHQLTTAKLFNVSEGVLFPGSVVFRIGIHPFFFPSTSMHEQKLSFFFFLIYRYSANSSFETVQSYVPLVLGAEFLGGFQNANLSSGPREPICSSGLKKNHTFQEGTLGIRDKGQARTPEGRECSYREQHGKLPPVPTMTPSPKSPVECTEAHKICSPSRLFVQTIEGAKTHV